VLAILYLAFTLAVTLIWQIKALEVFMPDALSKLIYPIYKSHLAPVAFSRAGHLSLATDAARLARPDEALDDGGDSLRRKRAGTYCLGVLLSFMGFAILSQFSSTIAVRRLSSASPGSPS
jgi:hypothetical protein